MPDGFTRGLRDTQVPVQATGELGGRNVTYQPQQHRVRAKEYTPSFMDSALTGLAELGQKYASLRMESEMERAYVAGQQQHKAGVIEEKLESNWLTRPFVRGGWRDSEILAELAEDFRKESAIIKSTGKKQNPEDYLKDRQERVNEFLARANIQGATARMRGKAISMLMQQDEQLAQEYAKEHSEYSAHERAKRDNAFVQTVMASLPADILVQTGREDVSKQVETLYAYMQDGLEDHPEMLRGEIRKNLLEALYEQGHVSVGNALYDAMLKDGTFGEMSLDTARKLSESKAKAMEKTGLQYKADAAKQLIQFRQMKENGQHIPPEFATDTLVAAVESGAIHLMSANQFADLHVAASAASGLQVKLQQAEAFFSGNRGMQVSEAWTEQAMSDQAWDHAQKAYGNRQEAIQAYLGAIVEHKWGAISKDFVSAIEDSFTTYMQADAAGTVPEQAVQTLETAISILNAAKGLDKEVFVSNIVSKASPEMQAVMMHALNNPGSNFAVNMQQAAAILQKDAEMNLNSTYAALRDVKHDEEVGKFLEDEHWTGWHRFKARLGIFGANQTASDHTFEQYKDLVSERVQEIRARPGMRTVKSEHIMRLAAEEVSASYINWHSKAKGSRVASVFLPDGFKQNLSNIVDAQGKSILGGSAVGDADLIEAMRGLYDNPKLGSAVEFITEADGSIQAWYYNIDQPAERHPGPYVDQIQLAGEVRRIQQERIDKVIGANTEAGSAKVVQDRAGKFGNVTLGIHGKNSLGIDAELVQQWRSEIVDAEAFSSAGYKDSKGIMTIGAGRNIIDNPLPHKRLQEHAMRGGNVSPEYLTKLFLEDTNRALMSASSIASDYGFERDVPTLLAVADAVYQMGEGNAARGMRSFQKALPLLAEGRDYEAFAAEVRDSQWFKDTPKRVETFLKRTKKRFDNAPKQPDKQHYGRLPSKS